MFWAWVVVIDNWVFLTKFFCLHFVLVAVHGGIGSSNFGSLQLLGAAATSLSHCLWFIDPSTSFGCLQATPSCCCRHSQGSHEGARALPIFGKMPFQVPFLQTHFQCLRQLFLMASCDIRAQRDTPYARCPCISVVPETTLEGRHISSKGTRELLGGTTGNSDSWRGVIDLPSNQINEFLT